MSNSCKALKEYWSEDLGASLDIPPGEILVCTHGAMKGYRGILAFKQNDACILSAPDSMVDELKSIITGKSCDEICTVEFLEDAFAGKIDRIIPGWMGGIAAENFQPCHSSAVRKLQSTDWPLFEQFLAACSAADVDVSSLESGREPCVGVFVDDKVVAASGFEVMGDKIAHIGILTDPQYRHTGYARQAISMITETVLNSPLGPQYWTHKNNAGSVKAAQSLGYRQFADTIGIRLK